MRAYKNMKGKYEIEVKIKAEFANQVETRELYATKKRFKRNLINNKIFWGIFILFIRRGPQNNL